MVLFQSFSQPDNPRSDGQPNLPHSQKSFQGPRQTADSFPEQEQAELPGGLPPASPESVPT